ncbi:MAG: hypothetical protein CVT95_11860 [Bacteroidetes bacterium HGW-Bacteroidetes-12]|nr:MAG: hypothetical protein CVT95_11860 [Bacteroidetes bacterium HGW-Bacteroidetes-12]
MKFYSVKNEINKKASAQQGFNKMQAISGLGNFSVSIQLPHRGTMTMFQPPALYQPPAVSKHSLRKKSA